MIKKLRLFDASIKNNPKLQPFFNDMNCRPGCGACCIVISISSPILGLPEGKPAGVKCIHLTEEYYCAIFGSPERPRVCESFKAEEIVCGSCREEAMKLLSELEYGKAREFVNS